MTVQAKTIKDIKDRDLYYVVITNDLGVQHVISVGKKTYDAVHDIVAKIDPESVKIINNRLENEKGSKKDK